MHLLKEITILIAIILVAAFGLAGISLTNSSSSAELAKDPSSTPQQPDIKFSNEFYSFKHLIENQSINPKNVEEELLSVKSKLEKKFLAALLKKREWDFDGAFNQLFLLLDDKPTQLLFYEELASISKISGNLKKIEDWLKSNKEKSSIQILFLDALVEVQNGNGSVAIEKFGSLVDKGILSREIFFHLANACRIVGDYDSSLKYVIEAEKISDNDQYLSKIVNLKGTIYFLSGDYDNAKNYYETALELSKKNENRIEEIKSVANLAIVKDQFGEVFDARKDFQSTIKNAEEINNIELLAFLYSELGVSFTYTNNLIESRENYEKSYQLYEKLRNNERLSYLSSNIGSLYLQISNYKSALKYYTLGVKYAGENKLGRILNLTGLGDVYSNESNYSKALHFYDQAKTIADSIKDISSALKIDQGIGVLYYNINRPDEALDILLKAESQLVIDEAPFETIKLFTKLGTILTYMDSSESAEKYFQKGLSLAEKAGDIYSSIVIRTELALNYIMLADYVKASKILNEVQAESKSYELTQLIGLQDLYWGKLYAAQKKSEAGNKKLLNAYQLSGSVSDYNTQIEAAYLLGENYLASGNPADAENWYKRSIDLIEKISSPLSSNQEIQIAHFSGLNSVYDKLSDLYLKQGRGEEAFIIIDKAKSRNTKANLNKLKLLSYLDDESNYNDLIDIEWMISSGLYNETAVDSLKNIYSDLEEQLFSSDPDLKEIFDKNKAIELSDLQKKLDENEYLLSTYIGNNTITVFNLNSNGLVFETINICRDSLLALLNSISPVYRTTSGKEEIYINEDLFSFNAYASYRLYEIMFKNCLSQIPKGADLIISFPAELVKFPIEMLVTNWNEAESPFYYDDKNFLLDDYTISYTPSASIYIVQKEKMSSDFTQNLLLGDPFIENSGYSLSVRSGLFEDNSERTRNIRFSPLEFSEDEIESIDNTIDNNLVLLSKDATESNFKKNSAASKIVHISTHSFLIKDQPLILFTPDDDEQDDGFLELGEIVQLNLNCEMVVLSSCRSGLGKLDKAEGIIGMQKAFFEAGSKSVVVSLWDVNDKYTSYFMKGFYENLASGKSKSDALRQAKLDFIKNYSANPYYWSAFILAGNTSSIKIHQASSINFLYVVVILMVIGSVYFIWKKFLIH